MKEISKNNENEVMVTILWTECGKKQWEQCSKKKADSIMRKLIENPNVTPKDICILFHNELNSLSYGDTYDLPIGTIIKVKDENIFAVVKSRKLTDKGVKYLIRTKTGYKTDVFSEDIEVVKMGTGDDSNVDWNAVMENVK